MSKKKTANILLTVLMCAASVSATANYDLSLIESQGDDLRRGELSHRFQNENMGSRYRRGHKENNICFDVKKKMKQAQQAYVEASDLVSQINIQIERQQDKVEDKRESIAAAQTTLSNHQAQQAELKSLKQNKARLQRENDNIIASVISQLPAAQEEKNAAQARKNKKCDWRGNLRKSCREAKKRLSRANDKLNSLQSQKSNAQAMLDKLSNIDNLVSQANKKVDRSSRRLNTIKTQHPTLQTLNQELRALSQERNNQVSDFDKIEEKYGRLAVKTEKCQMVQYEARKGKAFKAALMIFTQDNGAGCEEAVAVISQTRGYAAKEGVNEAYELVCKSDILTKIVEVKVEVPVAGECESPIIDPINEEPSEQFIEFSHKSRFENRLDGVENEVILEHHNASQIKLDINGYDIESNYDYLVIEDQNGNQIAKLTNSARKQPFTGVYSTGWVDGSKLVLRYITDNASLGQGFEIEGFSIR